MAISPYYRRKLRVNELGFKSLEGVATNQGTVRLSLADGQAFLVDTGADFTPYAIPSGATGKGARRYKAYIYEGTDVICGFLDVEGAGETLGSELAVNGAFAADTNWTKGTGWSIGAGVATKTAGTAASLDSAATVSLTKGKLYKLTFDLTVTAGTLTFMSGANQASVAFDTAGSKTVYFTEATGGSITIKFSGDAAFAGTIDNVVLKEVSDPAANTGIKLFAAQVAGSQNVEGAIASLPSGFSLAYNATYTYKIVPLF